MTLLRRWAIATFVFTFLTIVAGGIVRTTQSGMGCPDWPTCFGRWIPPVNASQLPPDFEKYLRKQDIDHTFNVFHTWTEYINRLIGAVLGLLAVIQFLLLFLKRKANKTACRMALAFLVTVLLTGLFGALVVKLNLAHISISVHLFFAIVLLEIQLALLLSLGSRLFTVPVNVRTRQVFYLLLAVLLIQAALGTGVRIYVDEVSKVLHYGQREKWLAPMPVGFLIHRSFSWIVLLLTTFVMFRFWKIPAIRTKLLLLFVVITGSMMTGIVLFYADMPAIAQPVHLLLASCAITLNMTVLLETTTRPVVA